MAGLRRDIVHDTGATPDRVLAVIGDLRTYPDWLSIVSRVEGAPSAEGDAGPASLVTLRAHLGPITRSKRLRMVRTRLDVHGAAFERRELDGRRHSDWRLDVDVAERGAGGTRAAVRLSYGGGLLEPVIGRLLDDEIVAAGDRLEALLVP